MELKFIIDVTPRTKKNSQRIIPITTKTGKTRYILLPSKEYEEFETECLPYLFQVKNQTETIFYPVNIQYHFYVEKRLRYDLTNLMEAADDAMVKSGLIFDDNRDIIAGHDGSRVFHDKNNPRIEVTITKMTNYTQWKQVG